MPGYFVHLASAPEEVRSSEIGLKGLIAPDLWKKKTPTVEEYLDFFAGCFDAPSYAVVKSLCDLKHGGTHFGSEPGDTNHADFTFLSELFAKGILEESLFFKGFIHHLRVDKNFYADSSICDAAAFDKDFIADEQKAMNDLHLDWDKTNHSLSCWYPEVVELISGMPEKVQNVIQFVEGETKYVALEPMKRFIEGMRKQRTLEELLNP